MGPASGEGGGVGESGVGVCESGVGAAESGVRQVDKRFIEVMEGKKEGKDDTSSESEADDSGIFTKIKEKVADALD